MGQPLVKTSRISGWDAPGRRGDSVMIQETNLPRFRRKATWGALAESVVAFCCEFAAPLAFMAAIATLAVSLTT